MNELFSAVNLDACNGYGTAQPVGHDKFVRATETRRTAGERIGAVREALQRYGRNKVAGSQVRHGRRRARAVKQNRVGRRHRCIILGKREPVRAGGILKTNGGTLPVGIARITQGFVLKLEEI